MLMTWTNAFKQPPDGTGTISIPILQITKLRPGLRAYSTSYNTHLQLRHLLEHA